MGDGRPLSGRSGRRQRDHRARRRFRYAPSYVDAGLTWSIDPVNLPFQPESERAAPRYGGLHDVLRDACPDAWGQALLRREHNLPDGTPAARHLVLASNADRWGALAVGTRPAPSVAHWLSPAWREAMHARMQHNIALLKADDRSRP